MLSHGPTPVAGVTKASTQLADSAALTMTDLDRLAGMAGNDDLPETNWNGTRCIEPFPSFSESVSSDARPLARNSPSSRSRLVWTPPTTEAHRLLPHTHPLPA